MQVIELNGKWDLRESSKSEIIPANVPGCVHNDLLQAGMIEDPYYRDNEKHQQWIGESDWEYTRKFLVEGSVLSEERVELDCHGLDTFGIIKINDLEVIRTNNMFRRWTVDVKQYLRTGENRISVCFKSTLPYSRKMQLEHPMFTCGTDHKIDGVQWVRKEQCNYGWDWGPQLVTCGIWRPIRLVASSHPTIEDVLVMQSHDEDGTVGLEVNAVLDRTTGIADLEMEVLLKDKESVVAQQEMTREGISARAVVDVKNPMLWWPHGMGDQPMYEVEVCLKDSRNTVVESRNARIGLRHLELIRESDEWGESFKFRANGRDFFAKGANWIPADTFDARVDKDKLRDLLESARWANMNCIRVWGGGLYERDEFYDLCDELGLVVWQDFMFSCSAYPSHDKDFLENVRIEAVQNVKRLRHHPSLILWCGNNELELIQGVIGDDPKQMPLEEYSNLFDILLKDVVNENDPGRPYWPSSDHSPYGQRTGPDGDGRSASLNPRCGDAHLWSVWHELQPFEWYRTSFHRFCSEFGFQSFPHPKTVESYTNASDRNITSYIMELHQRSPIGNAAILHYMLSWFRMPVGNENTLWASQILQALAIKYAVEHWRRNMPRCMGALYWQLNDCWPVASWASIDSAHRWKALHYAARRFFAPVIVSGVEKLKEKSIEVFVSSDLLDTESAVFEAYWICMSGDAEKLLLKEITIPADGSRLVAELDLSEQLEKWGDRGGVVYLRLLKGTEVLSDNVVHLVKPKHLDGTDPVIQADWSIGGNGAPCVTLTTNQPSLWTWPYAETLPDLRWSDSFFSLMPGFPKTISLISGGENVSLEDFTKKIEWMTLSALWD